MRYGRIDAPIKVDITTGDTLYPAHIHYRFDLMFDQGFINVPSYHPATVLAEKIEAVLQRGEANTRSRDFYDLYAIPRFYSKKVDADDLRKAILHTSENRGSRKFVENWKTGIKDIRTSDVMHRVWEAYVSDTPYAQGLKF